MDRIYAILHRVKPYAYAILSIALACLLVLFFANDFFTQYFTWAPTRGEIVKTGIACVVVALLIVAGIIALPFAVMAAAVLALFMDYSFLSIFKVTWVTLTVLIAAGFFLGKLGSSESKSQWVTDQERQELERQCRTAHERNIKVR